ncbi:MAG TPA: ribosome silencing factor [Vicinamibacterales bacterium]|jgi:ribosome-associated protein|nr:ribosome silencing factor [Vicinamibacterales bacterium]
MKKAERRPRLPKDVSVAIAAAQDKKASGLVVLDLRRSSAFTDYFLLCTGQNQRQVKAIADAVEEALKRAKLRPAHVEGYDRAEWVLLDYFTFIVHIFTPTTREFYGLERLWGQAVRIVVDEPEGEATGKASGPARRA